MLLGVQNWRKARLGGLAGLQDPAIMAVKRAKRKRFGRPPGPRRTPTTCKGRSPPSTSRWPPGAKIRIEYGMLEHGQAFQSSLFGIARTLVRLAEETEKPNAERLREYRESNLASLKLGLFSEVADLSAIAGRAAGRFAKRSF